MKSARTMRMQVKFLQSISRNGAAQCALAALVFIAWPAWSESAARAQFAALELPHSTWSELQSTQVFGLPSYWRSFTTNKPLLHAAQALALHGDVFQNTVVFSHKAVLSGEKSGWHWVAEIDAAAVGATGVLSAISMGSQDLAHALAIRPDLQFAWVPPQALLRHSQRNQVRGRQVIEQVYSAAMPADQLRGYVAQRLHAEGWIRRSHSLTPSGMNVWQRDASELTLISSTAARGSALFVHHIE